MLGENFPAEDIDAIISETSGTNGKISYAEFLAQWKDQTEFVEEKRMIQEVTVNESVDQISVLSLEESDAGDQSDGCVARVNFIERKSLSERKLLGASAPESKSLMPDSPRKVMFQQCTDSIAE